MKEAEKIVNACVDQIIHDLEKITELVSEDDYDLKSIEEVFLEIQDKLKYMRQKLTIEKGGLILSRYPDKLPSGMKRSVICVETGKIYDSITQAAEDTGINGGNISSAVRGLIATAGGYHWEENIVIESERTIKRKPPKVKTVPIICVETGIEYPSIKAASEATGISMSSISTARDLSRKTAGGYHWKRKR